MNEPRALVALSEDRQWLVTCSDGLWCVWRYENLPLSQGARYEKPSPIVVDTGQSAHEVLAAWLEGRE